MQEKEREKRRDELFNEIKPMTLPKQEWRWKEAPQHSMAEPDADSQTATLGGQTAIGTVPGGQTVRAQGVHDPTEDEATALSSPHIEAGG
jgi:hypothetical protein